MSSTKTLAEIRKATAVLSRRLESITGSDPRGLTESHAGDVAVAALKKWVMDAHSKTNDPLRRIAFLMLNRAINELGIPASTMELWKEAWVYPTLAAFQKQIDGYREKANFWTFSKRKERIRDAIRDLRDLEVKALLEDIREDAIAEILKKVV